MQLLELSRTIEDENLLQYYTNILFTNLLFTIVSKLVSKNFMACKPWELSTLEVTIKLFRIIGDENSLQYYTNILFTNLLFTVVNKLLSKDFMTCVMVGFSEFEYCKLNG